jgi:hypothetical protein
MSEASTVMAMKRMNIVASELARRARLVVQEARDKAATDGDAALASNPNSRRYSEQNDTLCHVSFQNLEWKWNNAGVEAWPSMDVSLVSFSGS